MSAYITSIGTANPKNRVSQNEVHRFMTRAHQLNPKESDKLRALYRASGISYRYSVLDDYAKEDGFEFYENSENLEPFPSTKSRNLLFKKNALALSVSAIEDCLPYGFDKTKISHLITVSCTGLYAPGLDIELVNALDLPLTIQRTAINFMGCYAAFNALKVANVICDSDSEANVLIVCTELCSIHFQKEKADDNLLANALFGDGSAAVLVSNNPEPGQPALAMNKFACDLLPVGIEEMAWNLGDFGFEMRLSTYVPDVIDQGIDRLLNRLSVAKTSFEHYAIHPGGKKILNVVEQKLGISRSDNAAAHEILREYGNMSSPTVLFVLKRLMQSMDSSNQDDRIFSLAFGPGLTLESIVFQVTT